MLLGTANGHPAPATIRVANQPGDTRPLGVTLLYVVDNYPAAANTAAAVADFWRHIAKRPIRQVAVLQGPAAAIYGTRAANGAVVLSSKKPERP